MGNTKKASVIVDESYMQIKEAINTKMGDILKDYYIVPRFQRKYVWTKNEVTDFFNDINENPPKYFIGSLVLYNYKNEDNERLDVKGVVDGQQRITTTLLILVELRRLFGIISENSIDPLKTEAEKKYKGTYSSYIRRKDNDDNDRYILTSETSKDYLEELFSENINQETLKDNIDDDEEKKSLYEAYKTISKLLENMLIGKNEQEKFDILTEFRAKIENLLVIKVLLDDLDSAHIVFDSLNDRGKAIDNADKVKSYLMRLLKKGSLTTDSQLTKWNNLQSKINSNKKSNIINEFIEYHFKSMTDKNINSDNLFDNIKLYIGKDREKASNYLEELKKNIDYFILAYDQQKFFDIFNASDDNAKAIKDSISSLNNYGIKMHIPLLILLIREYVEDNITTKNISNLLSKLDKFHFKYNVIFSFPTNSLAPQYRKFISDIINEASDKNNLIRNLNLESSDKHNLNDKSSFTNNFKNKILYSESKNKYKKIVKDVLVKIDKKFKKSTCEINYNEMTIEHLISQSKEDKYDIAQIGNLILVNREMQNLLKDKDFKEKIKILENQGFFNNYRNDLLLPKLSEITKDVKSPIEWINSRTAQIIDIFFE